MMYFKNSMRAHDLGEGCRAERGIAGRRVACGTARLGPKVYCANPGLGSATAGRAGYNVAGSHRAEIIAIIRASFRSPRTMTTGDTHRLPRPRQSPPTARKRLPLHTRILIGLVVGAVAGAVANYFRDSRPLDQILEVTDTIGRVFLRLVFMVVLPLVISALALGVLELGDLRRLGRVGADAAVHADSLGHLGRDRAGPGEPDPARRAALAKSSARSSSAAVRQGRRRRAEKKAARGQVARQHAAGHHSREPAAGDGGRRRRQLEGERHAGRDVLRARCWAWRWP